MKACSGRGVWKAPRAAVKWVAGIWGEEMQICILCLFRVQVCRTCICAGHVYVQAMCFGVVRCALRKGTTLFMPFVV